MKTSSLLATLALVLSACSGTDHDDVIAVSADVRAVLRGDGMPRDQPRVEFEHDELWLELDGAGHLAGFRAHPWDLTPGQHTYDLELAFAPSGSTGPRDIFEARVCFVTCPDSPKEQTCAGDCFDRVQNGSAEVHQVSADGKRFDVSFRFDVADAAGRVIHVEGGEAVTQD